MATEPTLFECGTVAVRLVAPVTFTSVAAMPPTDTRAFVEKFIPVTVITVPPAWLPLVGETLVTVGGKIEGEFELDFWLSRTPKALPTPIK
jgi:hypothetical protein